MTLDRAAYTEGVYDDNVFVDYTPPEKGWRELGQDRRSVTADPLFVDPNRGDFRVKEGSPALALGFENFPMDRFGVQKPELKSLAQTWEGLEDYVARGAVFTKAHKSQASPAESQARAPGEPDTRLYTYRGATLRSLVNYGRESFLVGAMELAHNDGVLIKEVVTDSAAGRAGLKPDTVIVAVDGQPINRLEQLRDYITSAAKTKKTVTVRTLGYEAGYQDYEIEITANKNFHLKQ